MLEKSGSDRKEKNIKVKISGKKETKRKYTSPSSSSSDQEEISYSAEDWNNVVSSSCCLNCKIGKKRMKKKTVKEQKAVKETKNFQLDFRSSFCYNLPVEIHLPKGARSQDMSNS